MASHPKKVLWLAINWMMNPSNLYISEMVGNHWWALGFQAGIQRDTVRFPWDFTFDSCQVVVCLRYFCG